MLRRALYIAFGVVVVGGYTTLVRRGYDPTAVRSEERVMPAGAPRHASTRRRYRQPSFIWFGGFGGK